MRLEQLYIFLSLLNSIWTFTDNVGLYLGCFKTDETSSLEPHLITSNMTISICSKVCSTRNLQVFALQYGRYCYCGIHESVFGTNGVVPDYECNIPCSGGQLCGGNNFIIFYKNNVFQGCYELPLPGLNLFGGYIPALTLDVCQLRCGNFYSGLLQGNKCYCSEKLPTKTLYGSASYCASRSLHCRGSEKCGGSGNIAIWVNEETRSESEDLYLGCYGVNFLTGPKWINDKMKTSRCSSFCSSNNYTMYALQNGTECSCGTYNDKFEDSGAFESRCGVPCPGEVKRVGDIVMKVYGGTEYEGCFIHTSNSSLLFHGHVSNVNPTTCYKSCQEYLYFGLSSEGGCYCGNELPQEDLLKLDLYCSNVSMKYEDHQRCGGYGFYALWTNLHTFQIERAKFLGCFPAPLLFDFKGADKSLETCAQSCQCSHLYVAMTESNCFCGDSLPQNDTDIYKTVQLLYSDHDMIYTSKVRCNFDGSEFQAVWEIVSLEDECNGNHTTIQNTDRNQLLTWIFFLIIVCVAIVLASLSLIWCCYRLNACIRRSLRCSPQSGYNLSVKKDVEESVQNILYTDIPVQRPYYNPDNGLYEESIYSAEYILPINGQLMLQNKISSKTDFCGPEYALPDKNHDLSTDSDNAVYFQPISF